MVSTAAGYRADIDGLRAVAVVPVVLFHLNVTGFRGGYVGVDVFFVISGFLITGLLRSKLSDGRLRLRDFYLARVRRLAPALLTVTVPTTVAASLVLFPEDMRSFAASLVAQLVSLQNFVFLAEGEYFRGADTKLLLHTWSLAVEEQFYLVWPLLLLLLRRASRPAVCAVLGALVLASFALNVGLMALSPKASFFLLPPRAWELALGGLLSVLCENAATRWILAPARRTVLAAVGLGLIALSVVTFDATTAFPGWRALLPVCGTGLVIAGGVGGPVGVLSVLGRPAFVHVGIISYPLYLWHWPLIVLATHLRPGPRSPFLAFLIVLVAAAAAELTHRFVERPIRSGAVLRTRGRLLLAVAATALPLLAFGWHAYASDGASYRFAPRARPFLTASFSSASDRCGIVFRALHPESPICALHAGHRDRRVLVWGNSHADMWSELLLQLAREQDVSLYLNARNCRSLPDSGFCGRDLQESIVTFVERTHITDVVLASTWFDEYGVADDVVAVELERIVTRLSTAGVRTWLVFDVPRSPSFDPLIAYRRAPAGPVPGTLPVRDYRTQRRREDALFDRLVATVPGVAIVDPSRYLCDAETCAGGRDGRPWYRDTNHLTHEGALITRGAFLAPFTGAPDASR